ncbi:DUF6221 family protein [Streptomyces sp. NPDC057620]|uniref:DUF6221 family protein n=1 Tax=Streptomyces sp. NPDC057620 TaxID=3346185 RepID=UPI0036993F3B
MDELVRWLGAQLDEDERIARAVEDRSAPFDGQWMADGNSAVRTLNGHVLFYRHDSGPLKPGLADHVVTHDPARVLREIEAKRDLLRLAQRAHDYPETFMNGFASALEGTLRLFAAAYTDRPGYQASWRP